MTEVQNKNGITFDIDAIATDLNGKMDKDGLNATCPVIVETYHSGTSWYRVYSDGWCEQGGIDTNKSASERTVNLIKQFYDSYYSVQLTYQASDGDLSNGAITTRSKTTNSFSFYAWSADEVCWQASGYIS